MLNALTQSSVYAERKMFATLDPTSRRLRLPHEREVVINDTVGFIRDLPEALVAAFRATLDEIADSDLLVHVVDGSNANCLQHIESVDSILNELGYSEIPSIVVINKSDLLNQKELESLERQISLDKGCAAVSVSAIQAVSLNQLVVTIGDMLSLEEIQEPQPGIEANRV
jgi:GTP-binding protein HflX